MTWSSAILGDVGLVAGREIRQRMRGKMFRYGTVVILLAVVGAIVIPAVHKSRPSPQHLGVVGTLAPTKRAVIEAVARSLGAPVTFTTEPDVARARQALSGGAITVALVNGTSLVVKDHISPGNSSTLALFVSEVARALGVENAYAAAGLTPTQAGVVAGAKPLTVTSIHAPPDTAAQATSIVGVILLFVLLNQYNTWMLMGIMEEKSSRVIEVLLAAVRPLRLLTGKVLGIGAVALTQAGMVVAVALVAAKAVGSGILSGAQPLEIGAALIWLVLAYAFYSWVYAAAGSTAERMDQIQSLAVPLVLPIVLSYVYAITVASSGNISAFFRVLSYLPPSAPFAMTVLVGLGKVTWWQFAASALISITATVVVARFAATIYQRSILRTGSRVTLRDVLARGG